MARSTKLSTDEARNDINVQSGPVGKADLVCSDESGLSTAIEVVFEEDCGIRAGSEVEGWYMLENIRHKAG
jgi:hypothetical protein